MRKLRSIIPSANALFAFEAAARLQSFTLAAEELNVSQPAISHAIKTLEKNIGKALFHRSHRKIELTQKGKKFYRDVSEGLEHIYYSANELQHNKERETMTISGSTLFIHYWMLPRINVFETTFSHLNLRLHSTDRDVSLHTEGIDISVRLGDGKWPDYDTTLFADEIVYPVYSPEYEKKYGAIKSATDLLNHRLLYVDEPFRIRLTWKDWFRNAGVHDFVHPQGINFNDAQLCMQAALTGSGIALAWHHIAAPMIKAGSLIRPSLSKVKGQNAMYLITPRQGEGGKNIETVQNWMIKEMVHSLDNN